MALLQTKHHGTVATHKVRKLDDAYAWAKGIATELTQVQRYTLVGSCPGKTMFVCPAHIGGVPEGADFCYITQVLTAKEAKQYANPTE